jgi:hypothetical protein
MPVKKTVPFDLIATTFCEWLRENANRDESCPRSLGGLIRGF